MSVMHKGSICQIEPLCTKQYADRTFLPVQYIRYADRAFRYRLIALNVIKTGV